MKILLPFIILILLVIGCKDSGKDAEAIYSSTEPIKITASQLIDTYETNPVAAHDRFYRKPVLVTGKLTLIKDGNDFQDIALVLENNKDSQKKIIAHALESERQNISAFIVGDKISLLCIGSQSSLENVISLISCKVAK